MTIRVRAPATTANVGPGFDCVAVALDLWNELEVSDGSGEPDLDHLGVRAFAQITPVGGKRFAWIDRIPRARGLGSSAAVIALGLAAASLATGQDLDAERLLRAGLELEGHPDNLAAALAGGACLTWDGRVTRVADAVPAVPIAIVPEATVSTQESRLQLPTQVAHVDAAFTAARATLLGAALASASATLFEAALADRLHEPYRAATAPLLGMVRESLPDGALGATLSGSGPTVVVWARADRLAACVEELEAQYPAELVLPLAVARSGVGPVGEP
jgi:homoserine kinase